MARRKPPVNIWYPEYWDWEEALFAEELTPELLTIVFSGGVAGYQALPAELRVLVSWDVFNQQVIDWLNKYKATVLRGISNTTRQKVVRIFGDWIRSGDALPALEAMLEPIFGERRATQIAVTEITRIYAEGNLAAWRSTNMIGEKRWNTAVDELVCPICRPLNGIVVPIDEGFTPEGAGLGPTAPPAHVNCRCWLTPVVSVDKVRDEIRRILAE